MKSIKDIYKITLNGGLLSLFYKICNKCIKRGEEYKIVRKNSRKMSM
jgi:hypothetical protein